MSDGEVDGPNDVTLGDRVAELEARSEFHSQSTSDLDGVLVEFTRRVEKLEREMKALRAELVAIADEMGGPNGAPASPG